MQIRILYVLSPTDCMRVVQVAVFVVATDMAGAAGLHRHLPLHLPGLPLHPDRAPAEGAGETDPLVSRTVFRYTHSSSSLQSVRSRVCVLCRLLNVKTCQNVIRIFCKV